MPCPTDHVAVISRGKGQSCMASCAYYSGTALFSEYEGCWKQPHSDPERVRHVQVMLPDNAPMEYADPQTLWNAVDASEHKANAQTARSMYLALPRELTYEQNLSLVLQYCQKEFVDKGMCCNFFYHDKGDGNPHVHIMLTVRAIDENGRWLPKSKNVYVLDENGERIRRKSGSFVRQKIDTVDWNDQKYCEIWRHDWEVMQNNALEDAGRSERVDMRSLARQGIERLPQKHLGPAAAAMESKGIETEVGNENRRRLGINNLLSSVQNAVKSLTSWISKLEQAITAQRMIENPEDYQLADVMLAYLEMRKAGRESWSNYQRQRGEIRDIQDGFTCISNLKRLKIFTVGDLVAKLDNTRSEVNTIKARVRANNQTVRDIEDYFAAREKVTELKAVKEKYDSIHRPSARAKYAEEHKEELTLYQQKVWLRDKLIKKLSERYEIPTPFDASARKVLKGKIAELKAENESMKPRLSELESDLDVLKQLRYWTKKVIPEALPDPEKSAIANELDAAAIRRDLERDMDAAVAALVEPPDDEQREREPDRQKPREPEPRTKPLHRKTDEPIQ